MPYFTAPLPWPLSLPSSSCSCAPCRFPAGPKRNLQPWSPPKQDEVLSFSKVRGRSFPLRPFYSLKRRPLRPVPLPDTTCAHGRALHPFRCRTTDAAPPRLLFHQPGSADGLPDVRAHLH